MISGVLLLIGFYCSDLFGVLAARAGQFSPGKVRSLISVASSSFVVLRIDFSKRYDNDDACFAGVCRVCYQSNMYSS